MSWMWMALGWALTPDQVDDRIRSMDDLELVPELVRRVDAPLTLTQGPLTITLRSGSLVPVFSGRMAGEWKRRERELLRKLRENDPDATLPKPEDRGDRELVGFVWVHGEGTAELTFPERADGMLFANLQVMEGGMDRDVGLRIARGVDPARFTLDQGVFLGDDPVLDTLILGSPDADPYEIVVYDQPPSTTGADLLLAERLNVWGGEEAVGERIARDRVERELGAAVDPMLLVDLHTDVDLHMVELARERWLGLRRDGSGRYGERWETEVLGSGVDAKGQGYQVRISGVPFAAPEGDDDGPRLAPERVRLPHVESRVLLTPSESEQTIGVDATARVTLQALQPTAIAEVAIPGWSRTRFDVVSVTRVSDGASLVALRQLDVDAWVEQRRNLGARPDDEPPEPDEEKERRRARDVELRRVLEDGEPTRIRLVFPERLQPGDVVDVDIVWKDAYAVGGSVSVGGVTKTLGVSSGTRSFLPTLLEGGYGDRTESYRATVGVPANSKLSVTVSGETGPEVEEDGWRLVRTGLTEGARWPNLVVGEFSRTHEKAARGMPAVNVQMFQGTSKELSTIARDTRQAVNYLEGWLPPYPVSEIDVTQSPQDLSRFTWKAPHGMAVLQQAYTRQVGQMTDVDNRQVFAHELAHQYFGQMLQPASLQDRWMVESFPQVYSCMYVAKLDKDTKTCERLRDEDRKAFEGVAGRRPVSLTRSYEQWDPQAYYAYGPFVLQEMLRHRVGTEAFFEAVDRMLAEHAGAPITNERFQRALEAASGQSLADFFDFWVFQGLLPDVGVTWNVQGGVVMGQVTSSVPFGTFDLELVVTEGNRRARTVVRVVDGQGGFRIGAGFQRPKVHVDPDHHTLVRGVSVGR